jgi:hypothetical protein
MSLLAACLWGFGGAAAVELFDLYRAIRRTRTYPWRHPDEVSLGPYLLSVVIRIALGIIAAGVCSASSQIAGPAGAFAAGYAAPKLFEQLGRLPNTERDSEYTGRASEVPSREKHPESRPEPTAQAADAAGTPPDGRPR